MRLSHISWNFGGLALPLLMAAIAVPKLLNTLGAERFGLLALSWGLIGYAGALDLGVGRATTHRIASMRAGTKSEQQEIPDVLFTAVRITSIAGLVAGVALVVAAICGAENLIATDSIPRSEIVMAMLLLAVALPFQAVSATYRGVNEAYANFRSISILRVLLGVANFGLPLLISLYSIKVHALIASLVVSRACALFIYRSLAIRCMPKNMDEKPHFSLDAAKKLFKFGAWFTLSSILNPIVAIADRFIIASTVSVTAVSFYVVPYEMVVQSLTVVGAITTVAFPYLSKKLVENPGEAKVAFQKMLLIVAILMGLISIFYMIAGKEILIIWLGNEFSEKHSSLIRILALGLIPYALGSMLVSWLHAHGKPNITAKINLIEFPVYICAIYYLVLQFGVTGAAYAWLVRTSVNALLLMIYTINKSWTEAA